MNTIVMNTLTGAVTEYTGFDFHAITPTHAGSVAGLYQLGGDLDIAALIIASVVVGKTLIDSSKKKYTSDVYFSLKGSGTSAMSVVAEDITYSYPFSISDQSESRCKPGRGIRSNYLAYGYSNTDGANFALDRIEVIIGESTTRRL